MLASLMTAWYNSQKLLNCERTHKLASRRACPQFTNCSRCSTFIDSHKPLYVCFLDLKGAYDQVDRAPSWKALRRLGISGQMINALRSMYANCSVAIKIGGWVSQSLPSLTGLKQGCPQSPTPSSLFSDGIHRHLLRKCPDVGPQMNCGRHVPDLGYADDFALLATASQGLQRSINAVFRLCQSIGMILSK